MMPWEGLRYINYKRSVSQISRHAVVNNRKVLLADHDFIGCELTLGCELAQQITQNIYLLTSKLAKIN